MGTGISEDEINPLPEVPEDRMWLIEIIKGKDPETRPKPRIQKVVSTLRQIESNKTCFDPLVVSFGPVYHGKECLEPMERNKDVTARWFLLRCPKKDTANTDNIEKQAVYDKFVSDARGSSPKKDPANTDNIEKQAVYDKFVSDARGSSPENCYHDESVKEYNQAEFMKMMFLDGCFIVRFIDLVVNGSNLSESGYLNQPLIMRDMFLLENQIPFSIVKALMRLMRHGSNEETIESEVNLDLKRFFYIVVHPLREPTYSWRDGVAKRLIEYYCKIKHCIRLYVLFCCCVLFCIFSIFKEPKEEAEVIDACHLLDYLRTKLIGEGDDKERAQKNEDGAISPFVGSGYWHYYFRPVMELKEAGVELCRSHRKGWSKIKFKQGLAYGHLKLPQIVVDDATRTRLLNLIAYEMCPDGLSDCTIATYICFLDSLIYNADDVKELRSKNILFNRLGSDKEVANLFKELASNLTPNYSTYTHVMSGIRLHRERPFNHLRVWIGQLIRNHFTSPWTIISLIAAIFLILLALVQTIYSVLSYYKGK